MEAIHGSGRARLLGVSNVNCDQLKQLCDGARVRPRFVQNRCYAVRGWDREVRELCNVSGITYQGFSLLTANRHVLTHPDLRSIARGHKCSVSQVIFRFALDVGILPLTGTTSELHMREDLDVLQFRLFPYEVAQIERLGGN
jgi:diketogulonate reductase-like aldo/keto reductase